MTRLIERRRNQLKNQSIIETTPITHESHMIIHNLINHQTLPLTHTIYHQPDTKPQHYLTFLTAAHIPPSANDILTSTTLAITTTIQKNETRKLKTIIQTTKTKTKCRFDKQK